MVSAEVISWTTGEFGRVFIVHTGDSAILPPSKRNAVFAVSAWAIVDWEIQESQ